MKIHVLPTLLMTCYLKQGKIQGKLCTWNQLHNLRHAKYLKKLNNVKWLFHFVACTLWKNLIGMLNSIDFYKGIFFHVISVRIIVSCIRQGVFQSYTTDVIVFRVCKSPVGLENRLLKTTRFSELRLDESWLFLSIT